MTKTIGGLFMLIMIVIACQQEKKEGKLVKNSRGLAIKHNYYPNGKVKEMQAFINDTIPHGLYQKYFENGQPARQVMYLKGKKHGTDKSFYPNGQVKYIGANKNDLADGITTWYYEDGRIKSKDSWQAGKFFGDQFDFYPSGQIHTYFFANLYGKIIYRIEFGKDGKLIKEEGIKVFTIYNRNKFHQGEKFEGLFYLATPPHTKNSFYIIDPEQKKKSEKVIDEYDAYKRVNYDKFFHDSGNYTLTGIYVVNDTINLRTSQDTVSLNIQVTK